MAIVWTCGQLWKWHENPCTGLIEAPVCAECQVNSFPSLAIPEPQGRWMSDLEWMKEQGGENIKLEEYNGFCIKPESIVTSFESLLQNSKRKSRPVVLNWSLFFIQGTFISDWRYFHCHNYKSVLLALRGQSPGMLLNIPQYEGQPPPQRIIQLQIPVLLRLTNSGLGMHIFLVPYGLLDRQIIWFWIRASDPEIPGNN